MNKNERDKILEQAAIACERTCGKWRTPTSYQKKIDPNAEHTCPCADAVRALKEMGP